MYPQKVSLPSHKDVAGLLPGEDVIVLQHNLVCVPDDHPQFKPDRQTDIEADGEIYT